MSTRVVVFLLTGALAVAVVSEWGASVQRELVEADWAARKARIVSDIQHEALACTRFKQCDGLFQKTTVGCSTTTYVRLTW